MQQKFSWQKLTTKSCEKSQVAFLATFCSHKNRRELIILQWASCPHLVQALVPKNVLRWGGGGGSEVSQSSHARIEAIIPSKIEDGVFVSLTQKAAEVEAGRRVAPRVAVHLEYLSGLLEVVLHDGEELAHLVASHRVPLAVVAVALERPHPIFRVVVGGGAD